MEREKIMTRSEKKQKTETSPPPKVVGWIALILGIMNALVLYYGDGIYIETHNAGLPPALIFLCTICGWPCALGAIKNREYVLGMLGIVFSLPSVAVFLWFVSVTVVPWYIQWFIGG